LVLAITTLYHMQLVHGATRSINNSCIRYLGEQKGVAAALRGLCALGSQACGCKVAKCRILLQLQ
jgi:hypothetical protein